MCSLSCSIESFLLQYGHIGPVWSTVCCSVVKPAVEDAGRGGAVDSTGRAGKVEIEDAGRAGTGVCSSICLLMS